MDTRKDCGLAKRSIGGLNLEVIRSNQCLVLMCSVDESGGHWIALKIARAATTIPKDIMKCTNCVRGRPSGATICNFRQTYRARLCSCATSSCYPIQKREQRYLQGVNNTDGIAEGGIVYVVWVLVIEITIQFATM